MAMQAGMGLGRIVLIIGAGYTGTMVLKNGKLSDVLAELQELIKDKSGGKPDSSGSDGDILASQVRRLAMEVRQLASARPITVLNGNSGQGNITAYIIPAATLGAIGYGYMWWKGFSFSDLMYVTKHNMTNAVSSMTKHLEQVSAALSATKRHLTQRIENLDGKLDQQNELSKEIKKELTDTRHDISNMSNNVNSLKNLCWGLDEKMNAIEDKQDFTCAGVYYLCQFVGKKDEKIASFLQEGEKFTRKRFLGCAETKNLKGLQHIAEVIETGKFDKSKTEAIWDAEIESVDNLGLSRTSVNC